MSGERQHFIPRFLQSGFSSRVVGEEVYVWVYRKDRPPFEPNTRKVGAEVGFYDSATGGTLDDEITDAEDGYSSLLRELREGPTGIVSQPTVPSLISHLLTRTRNLRLAMKSLGSEGLNLFTEFLEDDARMTRHVERKVLAGPDVQAMFKAHLRKQKVPLLRWRAEIKKLSERFLEEELRPVLPRLVADLRDQAKRRLPELAKSAHVAALSRTGASPAELAKQFRALTFVIQDAPGGNLILGDSVIFFEFEGDRRFRTVFDARDTLRALYLPVTPTRVLVGSPTPHVPVVTDLRDGAAQCSFEYFIAHDQSSDNERLQDAIGRSAELLPRDEMESIFDEVLDA